MNTSLLGFPGGSDGKASASNAGDLDSIPGLGRSPGEGNGTPLQYSCLSKQGLGPTDSNGSGWIWSQETPVQIPALPLTSWLSLACTLDFLSLLLCKP